MTLRRRFLQALLCFAPLTLGQADADREFEVVSIRANRSGEPSYRIRTPPGRQFTATNVSARTLLLEAFHIKPFQLSEAPGWVDNERFDIAAKLAAGGDSAKVLSPEELAPLIETVLVSRFGLRVHRVTKTMPVFALVAAKGGPRLHPNTTGTPGHETDWGKDHINAHDVTLAEFGKVLETQLDRAVLDDTRIPGTYDFSLKWTPDIASDIRPMAEGTWPSLFTAIREQYGLQLKARKGPVEFVVVDRMERPSGN